MTEADSMLKGIKRRRVVNKRCPVGGRTSQIDFHSFSSRHSRAVYHIYRGKKSISNYLPISWAAVPTFQQP